MRYATISKLSTPTVTQKRFALCPQVKQIVRFDSCGESDDRTTVSLSTTPAISKVVRSPQGALVGLAPPNKAPSLPPN